MAHGSRMMALTMAMIYEHFGKVSPEQALQATRFADAVCAAERELCAKLCNDYSAHLIGLSGNSSHLEHQAHGAEACSNLIRGNNEYGDAPDSPHFGDSFGAAIRKG